jgi:hypothetical protein
MSHPQYPLLDYDYDKDYRAAHMEYRSMDEQMPLLKPRTHTPRSSGGTSVMRRTYGVPVSSSLSAWSGKVFRP